MLGKIPQLSETVRVSLPNAVPSHGSASWRVVVEVGTVISPVLPKSVLKRMAGFSPRGSTCAVAHAPIRAIQLPMCKFA